MDIQRLASTLSAAFMGDLADPMWVKDASHRYVSANKAFCGLCAFVSGDEGLAPGDIVDGTDFNLFPLEVAQAAQQDEAEVLRTRSHKRSDLVLFNLAGEPRRFQVLRIALFDDEGKVVGTLGHAIDITERTARRAQLRERERILSNVLGHMPAVAFQRQMDADWSMEYLSEGCLQLTGYEPARFIGNAVHSWGSLIEKDDYVTALQEVQNQLADDTQYSVQYRITLPDGELRWVSERGVGVAGKNGELENLVGVVFDFTETRHYLDEMVHRDTHDALTGVANRPVLIDHLRYGISYGERYKRMVATVVMNIDHFKYVNQSLGHDAGDELLVGVARRLRAAVRDHDTVARLGADSFALTLIEIENIGGAVQAMKRVLADVHKPFMLGEQEVVVTCSVGCALYPNDGLDPETLLRRADTAMRHARGLGGDCYYFYSAESDRATEERFYMEAQLRQIGRAHV